LLKGENEYLMIKKNDLTFFTNEEGRTLVDRFISPWQDFYDKMNDEDKSLLLFYFHAELD
jgi:hypothetical protein